VTAADKNVDAGIARSVMKQSKDRAPPMRDQTNTTAARYSLELEMIERASSHGEEMLRSEFTRALNASYFMTLSAGDMQVGAITRSTPQEGVSRYSVEMLLDERHPSRTDAEIAAIVEREFARAQNASYFLHIAVEDFTVRLVSRERLGEAQLNTA
jgi:RNA polymerase-interacting CarD/CdnL/TRCF family regulator